MKQDGESTSRSLRHEVAFLLQDETGLTTLEYALLLVLLVVGVIIAYRNFGIATADLTAESTRAMPDTR